MLVTPISFGGMAGLVVIALLFLAVFALFRAFFGALTRPQPSIADLRRRRGLPPPAKLTKAHIAFAWGVPSLVLALILIADHLT